jgi:hypothetical protein
MAMLQEKRTMKMKNHQDASQSKPCAELCVLRLADPPIGPRTGRNMHGRPFFAVRSMNECGKIVVPNADADAILIDPLLPADYWLGYYRRRPCTSRRWKKSASLQRFDCAITAARRLEPGPAGAVEGCKGRLEKAHERAQVRNDTAGIAVTSVIALHDLNHALGCDRIGVLAGGRLVALGAPDEVLTVERLSEVFGVRVSVVTDRSDGARLFRFHSSR